MEDIALISDLWGTRIGFPFLVIIKSIPLSRRNRQKQECFFCLCFPVIAKAKWKPVVQICTPLCDLPKCEEGWINGSSFGQYIVLLPQSAYSTPIDINRYCTCRLTACHDIHCVSCQRTSAKYLWWSLQNNIKLPTFRSTNESDQMFSSYLLLLFSRHSKKTVFAERFAPNPWISVKGFNTKLMKFTDFYDKNCWFCLSFP